MMGDMSKGKGKFGMPFFNSSSPPGGAGPDLQNFGKGQMPPDLGMKRPQAFGEAENMERFQDKGKGRGFMGKPDDLAMNAQMAPPMLPPQQGFPQGPAVPIFLAPATASITPFHTKPRPPQGMAAPPDGAAAANKQIAMNFVNSDRETQSQMLRDPSVARAIMQTLAESPQHGLDPGMLSMLGGAGPMPGAGMMRPPMPPGAPMAPAMGLPPPAGMPFMQPAMPAMTTATGAPLAWSGSVTLARNMGKRLNAQAGLVHGKVEAVELMLKAVAGAGNVLNVSHRVPFDEIAKRTPSAVLSLVPIAPTEQPQYDEYVAYFRQKVRAGVAKLDEANSLYVVPPSEDVALLRTSLYALSPSIPKNVLLGVVASATPQVNNPPQSAASAPKDSSAMAPPVTNAPSAQPAPAAAPPVAVASPSVAKEAAAPVQSSAEPKAAGEQASKEAPSGNAGGSEEPQLNSQELLDLFSNPELIKLLSAPSGS